MEAFSIHWENKMGILLFTSGTTSKSKAVMLSQHNIASNVYAMLLVEKFLPTDVNLAFLIETDYNIIRKEKDRSLEKLLYIFNIFNVSASASLLVS